MFQLIAAGLILVLFLGMVACTEAGRWLRRSRAQSSREAPSGVSAAEGAVFALTGLLLAFTFSGAYGRFEDRRHLITEEANDIGTAYLRLELLPSDERRELQALFRRYTDLRATVYANIADPAATNAKLAEGTALQNEIWSKAVAAINRPGAAPQAGVLVLPALNAMIDITTTRLMATRNHPPIVIPLMLVGLTLVSAFLIGFDTAENQRRPWIYTTAHAVLATVAIYVITDLEYPRAGLIQVGAADQVLVDLRQSMK